VELSSTKQKSAGVAKKPGYISQATNNPKKMDLSTFLSAPN
jgi:hypothetical protein